MEDKSECINKRDIIVRIKSGSVCNRGQAVLRSDSTAPLVIDRRSFSIDLTNCLHNRTD